MGELPVETAVSSPSDSGGVVQLEGTVGHQLRKSSLTSGGRLIPKIVASCYVTVGTFARRGLSSTAKTLRSLSGVRGSEY